MKKLVILLAIIFALALATPVSASIIFDTGQPNNVSNGWTLTPNQWLAAEFSVNGDYTITDVQGFMGVNSGGIFDITLYSQIPNTDYYANLKLTELFSSSVNVQPTWAVWMGATGLDWTVSAGNYWIAFETTDAGFEAVMPWGAPNSIGEED
jgi:hypothetical protein